MKTLISVVGLTLISLLPKVEAQELKINSISIFDNGTSFYIKSGKVSSPSGHLIMKEKDIPKALYGTLWFKTNNIKNISTYIDTLKSETISRTLKDLIIANNEELVAIVLENDKTITGKLYVPKNKYDTQRNHDSINYIGIKAVDNYHFFNINEIKNIQFNEVPVFNKEVSKISKVLNVAFNNSLSKNNLEMMYLQNGLSWNPQYLLTLKSKTKAELKFRAEITNKSESIINTPINLVVGQPNFVYGSRLSDLVSFVGAISNSPSVKSPNMTYRAQSVSFDQNDMASTKNYTTNNDLYFYEIDKVSLSKGGAALYDVFTKNITIEHIYKSVFPKNEVYHLNNYRNIIKSQKVTHYVELFNKTSHPWVSGSVFILNDDGKVITPLAQEIVDYTAMTNSNCVKITDTKDIEVEFNEKIVSQSDYMMNKMRYHELIIEGNISINNFKKENVKLELSKQIEGILDASSLKWDKSINSNTVNLNYNNQVKWTFQLDKNKSKHIKYSYKVYIKR